MSWKDHYLKQAQSAHEAALRASAFGKYDDAKEYGLIADAYRKLAAETKR